MLVGGAPHRPFSCPGGPDPEGASEGSSGDCVARMADAPSSPERMPRRMANRTMSDGRLSPSLRMMRARWVSTVRGLIPSRGAISTLP